MVDEKAGKEVSVFKVAAYTTLGMIVFFFLMKLVGLVTVVELRFFNFIILFFGIRYVLVESRKANNGKLEYLKGMMTGFMTGIYTAVFFSFFICLYLFFDLSFMEYLKVSQPFGTYLTPGSAALVSFIEDISGGAIIAFALMHLLNKDDDRG